MISDEIWEKRTPKGMIRIRFAERDDFGGIVALHGSEQELEPPEAHDYKEDIKKRGLVVATVDNMVIGFAKFPKQISIRKDFRKIGIGRVMAAFSIKFAKEIKYEIRFLAEHYGTMIKMFEEFEKDKILKISKAASTNSYNLELLGAVPRQRENNITIFRKKHGWKIVK